ncbi:Aldolase-type TIM barrel [Penicillium chermesinum]|nr:Aldolase-type TIM barrel [Penicillium chermesinum]
MAQFEHPSATKASSNLNATSISSSPALGPSHRTNSRVSVAPFQNEHSPTVVIVYGPNQDHLVHLVAEILGKSWTTELALAVLVKTKAKVVAGVTAQGLKRELEGCERSALVLINTHCVEDGSSPEDNLTEFCDYEFLYSQTPFLRRDLTRFMALILGQTRPHEDLRTKPRTNFISTTFPDVHAALPNLDILSVGSDAVEIRVDLLVEPTPDGSLAGSVPSLKYVGKQLMLLRQHTELPIIFTTRCTKENGKFPMDDPLLFYKYLRRAIQWGVEGHPKATRRSQRQQRHIIGIPRLLGGLEVVGAEAQRIFTESAKYADIVKMIAMVHSVEANYELEYFRSTIKARGPGPLLSAVNMGQLGQLSRALNTVFSPITHPLLPMIAAPGQLTAAEINEALHIMGQLPKRDLYAIGSFRATPQSMFIRKCLNELGLPHTFSTIDRGPKGSMESILSQPAFGGASVNPPISSATPYIPTISEAARAIGLVDTIALSNATTGSSVDGAARIIGENATWKGIRATLTQEYVPSAYHGRAAIIVAGSETHASAAIFALRSLDIGTIYTVGFKAVGPLAAGLEPFTSIQSVKLVEQPFVIVSALPPEKSLLVQPLLRHYSSNGRSSPCSTCGKVYLDLTTGPRKGDPASVAASAGWTAYGSEDVDAWTTVETLRLLVGQNVPFDFVRMASGRPLF